MSFIMDTSESFLLNAQSHFLLGATDMLLRNEGIVVPFFPNRIITASVAKIFITAVTFFTAIAKCKSYVELEEGSWTLIVSERDILSKMMSRNDCSEIIPITKSRIKIHGIVSGCFDIVKYVLLQKLGSWTFNAISSRNSNSSLIAGIHVLAIIAIFNSRKCQRFFGSISLNDDINIKEKFLNFIYKILKLDLELPVKGNVSLKTIYLEIED